jgi:hypothetical protein
VSVAVAVTIVVTKAVAGGAVTVAVAGICARRHFISESLR